MVVLILMVRRVYHSRAIVEAMGFFFEVDEFLQCVQELIHVPGSSSIRFLVLGFLSRECEARLEWKLLLYGGHH